MRIGINLIPFSSVQGIEIFSQNIVSSVLRLKKDEEFFDYIQEYLEKNLNF